VRATPHRMVFVLRKGQPELRPRALLRQTAAMTEQATTHEAVALEVNAGIARLTLNRPQSGNAINRELCSDLRAHAESLLELGDIRAVVLTGNGPRFCVGGDLAYFEELDDLEAALLALARDFHAAIDALRRLDAPVIAGVRGSAAGGGLSLVCACDLAIAAESARFTMAYTAAGLSPDGGATWFLPRIVGWRIATELMLTNRILSAVEAAQLGIVNSVVADGALEDELDSLSTRIASGATGAYGTVKRLLRSSAVSTLEDQLEAEARAIAANAASVDGREGVGAFLEKRRPSFGG
jgi:2-(1,2-epoxy-1,2-dihydrophenyl)acetyl-CoA isomerase